MRLGLVVALPEEARALTRVMSGVQRLQPGTRNEERGTRAGKGRSFSFLIPRSSFLCAGTLGGREVMIAAGGAGAQGAERAAAALLERGAAALLAVGFAGALTPALQPGDLLAVSEIVAPDGIGWPVDTAWSAAFTAAANGKDQSRGAACGAADPSAIISVSNRQSPAVSSLLHSGKLVTVTGIVRSAAEKRRLGEATGALAVDMESAAVARCAAAAGVPMAALRAITDGAHETLPLDFELCLDSDGQFHHTRLIALLARHPAALGGLLRLGRHSALAGRALAACLVRSLPRVPR